MTSSRLLLAFIVTVAVGLIVLKIRSRSILKPGIVDERQLEREEQEETHDHSAHGHGHLHVSEKVSPTGPPCPRNADDHARFHRNGDLYFTIGVAITSVFKAYVTEDLILLFNQSEATGVGLMTTFALVEPAAPPMPLLPRTSQFLNLVKLAFLVFGPMMDVKLVFMYLAVFKSRFVITLAIGLFFVIGILSYLWFRI